MDKKTIWADHCKENYVPLYLQPDWMDLVCGNDAWNTCIVQDGQGVVRGAWIYYLRKKCGLPTITMPPLTAYSGLWLNPSQKIQKNATLYSFHQKTIKELARQLPATILFYQALHPDIQNCLPLHWLNFHSVPLYTYWMDVPFEKDAYFRNFTQSCRTVIRKADKMCRVKIMDWPEVVFRLYSTSLKRKGLSPRFSLPFFEKTDDYLKSRNQRCILGSEDEAGRILAILYLIWDQRCTYFVLSGQDHRESAGGALYLLFQKALEWNPGNSTYFDFEGSMLPEVEQFLRNFGGRLVSHYKISRSCSRFVSALSILLGKSYV